MMMFIQLNLYSQRFKIENGDTLPRKILVETFERILPYDSNEIMTITDSILEKANHTFELINGEIVNEIIGDKYIGKHISKYFSGKIEIDYYINDTIMYPSFHINNNDTTRYFQSKIEINNTSCLKRKYLSNDRELTTYEKKFLKSDTLYIDNPNGANLFSEPNIKSEIITNLKENNILVKLASDIKDNKWDQQFEQYGLIYLGVWLKVKTNTSPQKIGFIPSVFLSDKKN